MLHGLFFEIGKILLDRLLIERVRRGSCHVLERRGQRSSGLEWKALLIIHWGEQCAHRIHQLLEWPVRYFYALTVSTLCLVTCV